MGDVASGAAQEFWSMLVGAVTNPGPWVFVGALAVVVLMAAFMRGRLSSPWVWVPALGVATWWAFRHLPR